MLDITGIDPSCAWYPPWALINVIQCFLICLILIFWCLWSTRVYPLFRRMEPVAQNRTYHSLASKNSCMFCRYGNPEYELNIALLKISWDKHLAKYFSTDYQQHQNIKKPKREGNPRQISLSTQQVVMSDNDHHIPLLKYKYHTHDAHGVGAMASSPDFSWFCATRIFVQRMKEAVLEKYGVSTKDTLRIL